MTSTILDKIIKRKRERVARLKNETPMRRIMIDANERRSDSVPHAFAYALRSEGADTCASRLRSDGSLRSDVRIIAEIKRASPSKGVIDDQIDVATVARNYVASGAVAISVLTEEDFFQGSLDDLRLVKAAVDLPVLRKDFTIDEYQIYEAAAAGADAILLIVAALSEEELSRLRVVAENELKIDAIIEVHSIDELEIAGRLGANIVGVNNRDLKTFEVSLDVSRDLIARRPEDVLMIAESGLSTRSEIDELRGLGFDGFLIGEALMREPQTLASLAGGIR